MTEETSATETGEAPVVEAPVKEKDRVFHVTSRRVLKWGETEMPEGHLLAVIVLPPGSEYGVGFLTRLLEDNFAGANLVE